MGIAKLYEVIKKQCGQDVILKLKFSDLTGCRLAIDVSIFLYKKIKSVGDETIRDKPYWVNDFIEFLATLKKHGILVICVFDGPNPPIEKKEEQDRRRIEFEKIKTKKDRVYQLLKYVREQIQLPPKERDILDDETIEEIKDFTKSKKGPPVDYSDIRSIKVGLQKTFERLQKQSLPITEKHKNLAVDIVKSLGFEYIVADGEAETICCQLCIAGKVDGVLSEDTDVLAYGTPLLFSKIDIINERLECVVLKEILERMELEFEEFRDLCILLKCDYNKYYKKEKTVVVGFPPGRKKSVNIGPVHAVAMIKKYRTLEEVEEYLVNPEVLNYRRCRDIFSIENYKEIPSKKGPVEEEKVKTILDVNQCNIKFDELILHWQPTPLVFI